MKENPCVHTGQIHRKFEWFKPLDKQTIFICIMTAIKLQQTIGVFISDNHVLNHIMRWKMTTREGKESHLVHAIKSLPTMTMSDLVFSSNIHMAKGYELRSWNGLKVLTISIDNLKYK